MKLFYYRDPVLRNFGDDLNPWLWEKLLPGQLDDGSDCLLVGIGTILNDRLPNARKTAVFGSGVGYGNGLPKVDESWTIYCVRGPLSAERLGIDKAKAITDSALLLRLVGLPKAKVRYGKAYMPHAVEAQRGGKTWQQICEDLDVVYLDPRWPIEKVLNAIAQCEVLYTEAMHGAIVADALRVPWVPVSTSFDILPFKWQDWCLSVDLEYEPQVVDPPLFRRGIRDAPGGCSLGTQLQYRLKAHLTARQFQKMLRRAKPILSDDTTLDRLTEQLEHRLEQLRDDLANGRLESSSPVRSVAQRAPLG